MGAKKREGHNPTKRLRVRPHAKWANKLIALSHCQLSDTEREQVEAHLKDCPACSEAYLVYRGVASLLHDTPPPEVPPGLPPKLQQLKDELIAEDARNPRQPEPAAKPARTLRGVTADQPVKKRVAPKRKPAAASPADAAGVILPAGAEAN